MMGQSGEYHGISSDQEFLSGVRRKVNALQLTLREEEKLKAAKRMRLHLRCRFLLILALVSGFFWLWGPQWVGTQGTLYIWALVTLSLSAIHEYFWETRSEF